MRCDKCQRVVYEKIGRCIVCSGEIDDNCFDQINDESYFKQIGGFFWRIDEVKYLSQFIEYNGVARLFGMDVKELLKMRSDLKADEFDALKKIGNDMRLPEYIRGQSKHILREITDKD